MVDAAVRLHFDPAAKVIRAHQRPLFEIFGCEAGQSLLSQAQTRRLAVKRRGGREVEKLHERRSQVPVPHACHLQQSTPGAALGFAVATQAAYGSSGRCHRSESWRASEEPSGHY